MIPLLCCHKNKNFSFKDCRFRVEKCKESTARVVVFREFNIMNSFTLECSFYGKEENQDLTQSQQLKKKTLQHFDIKDFTGMGEQLIHTLFNYLPHQ